MMNIFKFFRRKKGNPESEVQDSLTTPNSKTKHYGIPASDESCAEEVCKISSQEIRIDAVVDRQDFLELILLIKEHADLFRRYVDNMEIPETVASQSDSTSDIPSNIPEETNSDNDDQDCQETKIHLVKFQRPVPLHNYNECYSFFNKTLKEVEAQIREEIKAVTGRRLPRKNNVISETIFDLKDQWSMDNIIAFCKECHDKFGFRPVQISIHSDEPHLLQNAFITATPHVHIIWIVYSEKGKRIKIEDEDMWRLSNLFYTHLKTYAERIKIEQQTSKNTTE